MTSFHEEMVKIYGDYENFVYKERKPRNSLVQGHGINDSNFQISPNISGKQKEHPAYSVWKAMLARAYSDNTHKNRPTYIGVTVCTEWLSFLTFAKWFNSNSRDKVGVIHLDKDLLIKGNKEYSPSKCVLINAEINGFLVNSQVNSIYDLPLGVSKEPPDKYRASIQSKYISTHNSTMEAHKAWQLAKLKQAMEFNCVYLERVINDLKYNIENNIETITL